MACEKAPSLSQSVSARGSIDRSICLHSLDGLGLGAGTHAVDHGDEAGSVAGCFREAAGDGVVEDLGYLKWVLAYGEGRGVDLLEGVAEAGGVEGDEGLAEGRGHARFEGGVPLAILFSEADDDDVGVVDGGLRANEVQPGALVVVVRPRCFVAEDDGAAVVRVFVARIRAREDDRQALDRRGDLTAPAAVDFPAQVHAPHPRLRRHEGEPPPDVAPPPESKKPLHLRCDEKAK
mmetsp:Transcript_25699/g.83324  ORF Transcript_25699/g.83324 Transcript_25699/m.83324 type:complete len:234 (+) Transcript_25699:102-803(+)